MTPFDDHDDRIAARAARMVLNHEAADVAIALRRLGASERTAGLARRHLDAMRSSIEGGDSALERRLVRLEETLAVLETIEDLEERLADDRWVSRGVRLAGRIASGRFDPDDPVHVRQHGDRPLDEFEPELADIGAVDMVRRSERTRFGVISSLEFRYEGGDFRCRRCPPDQVPIESRDLFHDRPVPVMDVDGVRRLIATLRGGG